MAATAPEKGNTKKVVIQGLTHDFLEEPIWRALQRGQLNDGYFCYIDAPKGPQVEITWKDITTLDMCWENPHQKLDTKVRVNGKHIVDAHIEANLASGDVSIEFQPPA